MSEKETKTKEDGSQEKTGKEGTDVNVKLEITGKEELAKLKAELEKIGKEKQEAEKKLKELEDEKEARKAEAEKVEKAKKDAEQKKKDASLTDDDKVKELEKARADIKKLEDEKKAIEEKNEDYFAKLEQISEQEYIKKSEAIIKKAEALFKDPKTGKADEEKIKDIKTKLEDPEKGPENLKMTEYMLNHLEEMLQKGSEQAQKAEKENKDKKDAENKAGKEGGSDATGQAKLTGQEAAGGTIGGEAPEEWDSYVAMISDLRKRARDPKDPEKQAEAQAQLNELWKRWAELVKADYTQASLKKEYAPDKVPQEKLKKLQQKSEAELKNY